MFFLKKWIFSHPLKSFLLFFVASSLVSACGPNLEAGAPIIRLFRFVGQDSNNARIFHFLVKWQDFEGDLGVPSSEKIPQGTKRSLLMFSITDPDDPHFQRLDVPSPIRTDNPQGFGSVLLVQEGMKNGEFSSLAIELGADSGKYPKKLKIQVSMWDSKGHASNKPWVLIKAQ